VSEESRKKSSICPEQEIKALSELSSLIQGAPADKSSFEEIFEHLGDIVDFRSASLYVFSKENGKLEELCSVGRKVDLIDFVNFEMGSGISAWVAKHGRSIVLNNLRKSKGGTHTKSFLSVPMVFAKEIIGVVNLAHDETEAFTKRDAEIVSIASTLMALLVERISREQLLSKRAAEIAALEQELADAKQRTYDKPAFSGGLGTSFYQKLSNPLAIISGNAQFLIMTLKAANPSVLKRLKAIDKEAGTIADISQSLLNLPSDSRLDFIFDPKTELVQANSR
jgi:transcriptional regulator with GAF, ATPase, and Fis domain